MNCALTLTLTELNFVKDNRGKSEFLVNLRHENRFTDGDAGDAGAVFQLLDFKTGTG